MHRRRLRAMLMSIDPLYLNFPANLTADVGPLDQVRAYVGGVLNAA